MSKYVERANILQIEVDEGVGDEVQFTKLDGGGLNIEIDEPWAGSTETGFGATTSVNISAVDVATLLAWLNTYWQPIATVPKDGTRVMLANRSSVAVGQWETDLYEVGDKGWTVFNISAFAFEDFDFSNPTHWMPLPPKPTE